MLDENLDDDTTLREPSCGRCRQLRFRSRRNDDVSNATNPKTSIAQHLTEGELRQRRQQSRRVKLSPPDAFVVLILRQTTMKGEGAR